MSDKRQEGKPDHSRQACEDRERPTETTILIVEDDESVQHLLQEALSLRGYRVITAGTVAEAEAHLQRQNAGAIGLVVTDVHLTADPRGQEGYTLYQRWSTVRPTLHFLVISGDPDSLALPAIRSGTVPFLPKPFTLETFLNVVQALVAG